MKPGKVGGRGGGRRREGSERQNMSGKCSSTCLQFIINFFKTVTKLRERGPVPAQPSLFRGADVTVCVLLCLFTCFLSASRSLRKHVLPKGPASAFFVCRRRAALLAYKHLFKRADGAALLGRENCPFFPPRRRLLLSLCVNFPRRRF